MYREIFSSLLITILNMFFVFLVLAMIEHLFSVHIPFIAQFIIACLYVAWFLKTKVWNKNN